MSESVIPLSGKKLAERWEIELIDILFVMMNHHLCVIDQFGEEIFIEDVLENYKKYEDFDIGTLMFRLSDVVKLEDDYLSGPLTEKRDVVRGKSLMEKWDIHEAEVFLIAFRNGWDFVDPFGFAIDYELALGLWNSQIFSIADALFSESQVEVFESESGHKIPKTEKVILDSPDISRIESVEQDASPAISFYKDGQMWFIGKQGEEKLFTHLRGFERIRFLIENEGKEFDPKIVFDLARLPVEDGNNNMGRVPPGVKISNLEKVFTIEKDEDEVNTSFRLEGSKQELLDDASEATIKASVALLKEQIGKEHDQEKRLEDEEKLKFLERHLQEAKDKKGKIRTFRSNREENPRLAVFKAVRKALKTIHEELPYMKEFINEDNIVTRYKCSYKQDISNPVRWVLDPPT
jgi:hypothetical protein